MQLLANNNINLSVTRDPFHDYFATPLEIINMALLCKNILFFLKFNYTRIIGLHKIYELQN